MDPSSVWKHLLGCVDKGFLWARLTRMAPRAQWTVLKSLASVLTVQKDMVGTQGDPLKCKCLQISKTSQTQCVAFPRTDFSQVFVNHLGHQAVPSGA